MMIMDGVFQGLGARFVALASERGDRDAVVEQDVLSYADMARRIRTRAAALRHHGVGPGDRFAVLSRNSGTMLELFFAASLSGSVMVPINHRLSPREIALIVADAEPTLFLLEPELESLAADVAESPRRLPIDQPLDVHDTSIPAHHASPDDVVVQMYTTGTTGLPKGALLSERNLAAMVDSLPATFMVDDRSRYLALLPMFHISGAGTPLGVLMGGGVVVLPRGTSADAILDDLITHRITHANLVPSLLSLLLNDPRTATADLTCLDVIMYGAAPSSGTVIEEMMALVPQCWFVHGYGLTECTGGVAFATPQRHGDAHSHTPGAVGRAATGCEIRIVDPDTLHDVESGQPGEIWVRSERTVAGYWRRPSETAALFAQPGWLRTGDIGLFQGDELVLKDRLKDMIISGGENVYSAEVEHVVASHPAVAEVAAVGLPDERWGEVVAVVVTARPGCQVDERDVIDFCRQRLAHYKCPKSVHVMTDLPRTGSGKILKRELRNSLLNMTYNPHDV